MIRHVRQPLVLNIPTQVTLPPNSPCPLLSLSSLPYPRSPSLSSLLPLPSLLQCQSGRSVPDAERIQLMQSAAEQSNGNRPIIQLSGYTFQRVAVDSVQAVDGTTYETLFIAAHKSGEFSTHAPYQVKLHIVYLMLLLGNMLLKVHVDMFSQWSKLCQKFDNIPVVFSLR